MSDHPKPKNIDLDKVMDGLPTKVSLDYVRQEGPPGQDEMGEPYTPDKIVVVLSFSEKGFGFGEVTFVQTKDGLAIDTECMSRDRVKKYLAWLVDNAVTDTDTDPEKQARYERIMNAPDLTAPTTEEEEAHNLDKSLNMTPGQGVLDRRRGRHPEVNKYTPLLRWLDSSDYYGDDLYFYLLHKLKGAGQSLLPEHEGLWADLHKLPEYERDWIVNTYVAR